MQAGIVCETRRSLALAKQQAREDALAAFNEDPTMKAFGFCGSLFCVDTARWVQLVTRSACLFQSPRVQDSVATTANNSLPDGKGLLGASKTA